jgi:hypothetical protein
MGVLERKTLTSGPAFEAAVELINRTQAEAGPGASPTEIIVMAMTGVRNAAAQHFGGLKTITEMEVQASLMATQTIGIVSAMEPSPKPATLEYALACGAILSEIHKMVSHTVAHAPAGTAARMYGGGSGPRKDAS